MFCTDCGAYNEDDNRYCRSCGKSLIDILPVYPDDIPTGSPIKRKNVLVAILLAIIPGVGQMYARRVLRGIVFMLAVLILPYPYWMILWVCGMIDSYRLVNKWNRAIRESPNARPW